MHDGGVIYTDDHSYESTSHTVFCRRGQVNPTTCLLSGVHIVSFQRTVCYFSSTNFMKMGSHTRFVSEWEIRRFLVQIIMELRPSDRADALIRR